MQPNIERCPLPERFVDLALRHQPWDKVANLPSEDLNLLTGILLSAGFEISEVVPGKIQCRYNNEDGPTDKTFLLNKLCPYKVIGEEGKEHQKATVWLDRALQFVLEEARRDQKNRDQIAEALSIEIDRSVPLDPIRLTDEGDLLGEYPTDAIGFESSYGRKEIHSRDHDTCDTSCGVHKYCNGYVDRRRATKTHDALVCRSCHMRVLFPIEVKTYGELRQALAKRFKDSA